MLSGVGDEGQQDQTDERLGDAIPFGSLLDGSDNYIQGSERRSSREEASPLTIVSSERGDNGDQQKRKSSSKGSHLQLFLFFLSLGLHRMRALVLILVLNARFRCKEISVRLELEDEVGSVYEEQHDGGPTGDDEKTRLAIFLLGARFTDAREQKLPTPTGLRREIGGRDNKRFCRP